MPAHKGGKKNAKHGRQKRKPSFMRYWSKQKGHANRSELHRARRVLRFEMMVMESRERKGK